MLSRLLTRAISARVVALSLFLAGCSVTDLDTTHRGGPPFAISTLSGDHQSGVPARPLAQPIRVRLVDSFGAPVPNADVDWIASDGGAIAPARSITDPHGVASAVWTLGASPGEQHARVMSGGVLPVDFAAMANLLMDDVPLTVLALATPDGSGQTVHPDFVAMPPTWSGAAEFLAITPYPGGNASFENPSIFAASDERTWSPPAGLQNPIVKPTQGYLSDPDMLYNPERSELWLYYRAVDDRNEIRLTTSTDGVHYSASRTVVSGANHTIVSPTVVRRGAGDWLMWSVNANIGCSATSTTVELRRSANGVDWSAPQSVSLSQPGFWPWHIDVQWIPSRGEFWALYNGKTPGSCTTPALFLATSSDGEHWTTYPSPVLARGAIGEFQDVVYRSSFAFDPVSDVMSFWYSGARYESPNYIWRSAYQRRKRADVFDAIARPMGAAPISLSLRTGVPPLLDAP